MNEKQQNENCSMNAAYLFRRLLWMIPLLGLIAFLAFALVRVAPGGPFDKERAPASPEVERALRAKYHLDEPFLKQFGRYLLGLARGDLGPSMKYRAHNVNDIVTQALPVSMTLGLSAFLLAIGLGAPWGILAAAPAGKFWQTSWNLGPILAISVPAFVVGPILVLEFAIRWRWFPAALWGGFSHLILPAITLGLYFAGRVARLAREGVRSIWEMEFVACARAKGLSEGQVLRRHVLRLGLLPVVSYSGPLLADLLTGSFVVENLFQIPGLGVFMVNSSLNRDYTMVVGMTLVYSALLLGLNLAVDLVYLLLDPRIAYE